MLKRYFIRLSYNGTRYHGWQVQDHDITVQSVLEHALSLLLKQETPLTGCGRTDAGVHAKEYFAHFDHPGLDKEHAVTLVIKLNSFLPPDLVVYEIVPVVDDVNARFNAISRTYQYFVTNHKNAFTREFSYHYYFSLDMEKMNEAAALLLKYDDFTSFARLHSGSRTNICKVTEAYWEAHGDELIFTISADRFLRNMVRAVVGTLLEVGRNKLSPEEFRNIIDAKDRSRAGESVPACGLFLMKVKYPEEIFI